MNNEKTGIGGFVRKFCAGLKNHKLYRIINIYHSSQIENHGKNCLRHWNPHKKFHKNLF